MTTFERESRKKRATLENDLIPLFYKIRQNSDPLKCVKKYADAFGVGFAIAAEVCKPKLFQAIFSYAPDVHVCSIIMEMIADPVLQSYGRQNIVVFEWCSSMYAAMMKRDVTGMPVSEVYETPRNEPIYKMMREMNSKLMQKYTTRKILNLYEIPEVLCTPLDFMFFVDAEGKIFVAMGLRLECGHHIASIAVRVDFEEQNIEKVFEMIYEDDLLRCFLLDDEYIASDSYFSLIVEGHCSLI